MEAHNRMKTLTPIEQRHDSFNAYPNEEYGYVEATMNLVNNQNGNYRNYTSLTEENRRPAPIKNKGHEVSKNVFYHQILEDIGELKEKQKNKNGLK